MSRLGKLPITIPSGVTISVNGSTLTVKGPKGTLTRQLHPHVSVAIDGQVASVSVADQSEKSDRALWGLFRSLIANMVTGVTSGYERKLEIVGVGYRAAGGGKKLTLSLGYSHPVEFPMPEGITASLEQNVITIAGIDRELLGETAAKLRRLRKPDVYKGKGIRYAGEVLRKKEGKTATKGS